MSGFLPAYLDDRAFQGELVKIAAASDRTYEDVLAEAGQDLAEMRGDRQRMAVRAFAALSRYLCRRAYHSHYHYDVDELEHTRSLSSKRSVVYLVTHKTYLDFFVLFDFLYRNGIAPPYIFGGVNMAFAGFGSLARRAGGIFIRRRFSDDAVYKAVLKRYIQQLIGEGRSFSWAIEGTRSRTGKLVLPKLGLLKYVVDASGPLGDDAIQYIPVSVSYDRIPDVIDMAAQEAGAVKKPESLAWFVRYVRGLGERFGHIYVRFGQEVRFHDTPDAPDLKVSKHLPDPGIVEVEKLAFEVCYRINEVTPATGTSLVLMSLLCRTTASRRRIRADVDALRNYLQQRQSASVFASPNRPIASDVDATLDTLESNGIVRADGVRFGIVPERYLVALYYSNMAVHHFVIAAFAELGLLNIMHERSRTSLSAFRAEVLELRDLFKFEFFFARKDRFRGQFADEFGFLGTSLEAFGEQGREAAAGVLQRQPLLVAYGVLSPYVNAYLDVARKLADAGEAPIEDQAAFVAQCQAVLRRPGAANPGRASKALLTNGLLLAANRGLLDEGPELFERRRAFVTELESVSAQLDEIRAMTS